MSSRFERTRVAERIGRQLLRAIVERTLAPGERLPSERSLASRLGVNRASLREAIKGLEQLGLVRTRQGDGTRVLDFMGSAGLEILQHLLPLAVEESSALLRDLLEMREILGREMARLAAQRAGPEEVAALRRVARAATGQRTAAAELVRQDMAFFAGLGAATQNRVVQLLVNSIGRAVSRHPGPFASAMPEGAEMRAAHDAIVDAIEQRDAQAAGAITQRYLAAMTERIDASGGSG